VNTGYESATSADHDERSQVHCGKWNIAPGNKPFTANSLLPERDHPDTVPPQSAHFATVCIFSHKFISFPTFAEHMHVVRSVPS
jgi:hypothetical protein